MYNVTGPNSVEGRELNGEDLILDIKASFSRVAFEMHHYLFLTYYTCKKATHEILSPLLPIR